MALRDLGRDAYPLSTISPSIGVTIIGSDGSSGGLRTVFFTPLLSTSFSYLGDHHDVQVRVHIIDIWINILGSHGVLYVLAINKEREYPPTGRMIQEIRSRVPLFTRMREAITLSSLHPSEPLNSSMRERRLLRVISILWQCLLVISRNRQVC